ncbi:MAG: hypothetical protein JXA92_06505 [candidate division Zixibacteria bacterium]|nr:hypothetical protein [candidate division Zixibacteria bacterium]
MENKFVEEYNTVFSDYISILRKILTLTEKLKIILNDNCKESNFFNTATKFAEISIDTSHCIIDYLSSGYIAHSFILLRWLLEMSHLCYYLEMNPKEYEKWLKGEHIRPKDIGSYIEGIGFHPWKETYFDWSNVVHGNANFVESYDVISKKSSKNNSIILIGNAIMNLIWFTQKFNFNFGQILKPHLGNQHNEIVKEYNEIDDEITKLTDSQKNRERDVMNS